MRDTRDQPSGRGPRVPEDITCAADVPTEEWEEYERLALEEGEPPDTPVDPKDLV
jgi:hypothetical protein